MSSDICPECQQPIKQAHKETLSRLKVEILMSAGQLVARTMRNRFKLKDVPACSHPTNYTNFQKLRYHGLIARVKLDGQPQIGEWCITRNGFRFLRGLIELPKFVLIRQNHIVGRSDVMVDLSKIWRGAPYLETSFEYFDDDGLPVGIRPMHHQQAALL